MDIQFFQDKLIKTAEAQYASTPLSDRVKNAFFGVPRHKFVPIYRNWNGVNKDWIAVTDKNLNENLSLLYADHPLVIFGEDEDFKKIGGTQFVSTISQPSFVLRMIDLLKLEEGHKVFELGAGSGWNAALMGRIVGPAGKIVSVEIIPELVKRARSSIKSINLENVEIHHADGGDGWAQEAPFDRAVFTAGSYDLPQCLFEQIKVGGLLLFVLKNKGGGDNLFLMEKKRNYFESIYSMACGFVPLTGKYHVQNMEEVPLDELLKRTEINNKIISSQKFWWGSASAESFIWSTAGLKSFLTISEDEFIPIQLGEGKRSFGFLDKNNKSLVVAYHDRIDSYGNEDAKNKLLSSIKKWVELGMPTVSNLALKIYPKVTSCQIDEGNWLSIRNESQFVWSLLK